jgi:hypothetical protein
MTGGVLVLTMDNLFKIQIDCKTGKSKQVPLTAQDIADLEAMKPTLEQRNAAIKAQRAERMKTEADPIFFQVEAGEISRDEWLNLRQKIRDDLPYEVE